jgi:hypothetical protein
MYSHGWLLGAWGGIGGVSGEEGVWKDAPLHHTCVCVLVCVCRSDCGLGVGWNGGRGGTGGG